MSCKNNGWNECVKMQNRRWDNVCYYKYKDNGCGSKKCNKDAMKTKGLLNQIKYKNDKLGEDLKSARENQKEVKNAVKGIQDDVGTLACELGNIEDALINAVKSLDDIVEDLGTIVPAQQKALADVNSALNNQKEINQLVKAAEDSLNDTVKCFNEKNSYPILIPCNDYDDEIYDSSCNCCRPNCGCRNRYNC